MAKNVEAIRTWVATNRPDVREEIDSILDESSPDGSQAGLLLLITVAFEAGREFQREHPEAPVGPLAYL